MCMCVCICACEYVDAHVLRIFTRICVVFRRITHMYVCVCVCSYVDMYTCTYMHIYIYICMYVYMYVCDTNDDIVSFVYVLKKACVHICVHFRHGPVAVYALDHVCCCAHVYVSARKKVHVHIRMCATRTFSSQPTGNSKHIQIQKNLLTQTDSSLVSSADWSNRNPGHPGHATWTDSC
jgi:hypothetical protein